MEDNPSLQPTVALSGGDGDAGGCGGGQLTAATCLLWMMMMMIEELCILLFVVIYPRLLRLCGKYSLSPISLINRRLFLLLLRLLLLLLINLLIKQIHNNRGGRSTVYYDILYTQTDVRRRRRFLCGYLVGSVARVLLLFRSVFVADDCAQLLSLSRTHTLTRTGTKIRE